MPAERRFQVMAKPIGAACNLRCAYCYYLAKATPGDMRMTDVVLERYLWNLLDAAPDGPVDIIWQGGEPTIRGLPFFRRAADLAGQFARRRQTVRHVLQTNGTLLDDEWGEFLAENDFLVGLSMDGPAQLHDVYRVDAAGRGSHALVARGWQVLRRHNVHVNLMCAVHQANQGHPVQVYQYFRDVLGAQYLQFIPVVERPLASRCVTPTGWGEFMCSVFDQWMGGDVGRIFVQQFDVILSNLRGRYTLCVHAPTCGDALIVEKDGGIYRCDHFVDPAYYAGNIATMSLRDVVNSPQQRQFGEAKLDSLPNRCVDCPVRWACHGGCPKDRDAAGINYLCEGYQMFFNHVAAW